VTVFQLSVNPSSGAVTIWIEAACGLRPLRVCADLEGVREFGQMLLDFYHARMEEKKRVLEFPVLILGGVAGILFSWQKLPLYPWVNIVGLLLLVAGYVIHLGYAHGEFKKLGVRPHGSAGVPEVLVTSGIYSKVRHPGYLGLMLIYFGLAVIFGAVWMLFPAAVFTALTVIMALKEEQLLRRHFGKRYEEYAARVPWRFIPGIA